MAFHNIPPNGFPDLPDMEELEAVVKDVNNLKTSVAGLATDVSNLSDNKANQITIAPFFDPETSYEVGDLVYYNGLNYRCTNDHEGEWDADDFAATTVAGELATLKSGLTSIQNQSGEVASGIIDGGDTVDVQLPSGVAAYLLCTFRDNDYFAGLYYLTYKVGDKIKASSILTNTSITVTDDLSDRHITIANGSGFPCCYSIKNLAHGY